MDAAVNRLNETSMTLPIPGGGRDSPPPERLTIAIIYANTQRNYSSRPIVYSDPITVCGMR
ncbi:hypothetical protein V8V88_05430, partial [Paenibacillus phytohabitans]